MRLTEQAPVAALLLNCWLRQLAEDEQKGEGGEEEEVLEVEVLEEGVVAGPAAEADREQKTLVRRECANSRRPEHLK